MKKLLTICALGALSLSVYAQGLVSIQETAFQINTNALAAQGGTTGKLSAVANSYYFELLVISDPSGSTTLPSAPTFNTTTGTGTGFAAFTDTTASGTNYTGINAGHINAIAPSTGFSDSSWSPGTTNFVLVVGWSANEGNWATVLADITSGAWAVTGANSAFGFSSVGYIAANAIAPAAAVFGANPGQLGGFTLNAIVPTPEPATMALAAIGSASLLLFRRRK